MTEEQRELQYLLEEINYKWGFDFREYKESTLSRRLARRLKARGVETYADYVHVLDRDATERERLFQNLTINVTSFFRDDVAFRALEEIVLPVLTESENSRPDKRNDKETARYQSAPRHEPHTIRVWSAGCATGAEPFSIAMLLLERLGRAIDDWDITILATDIDANVLEQAQVGVFSLKEVENVRPAWLTKYFQPAAGGVQVHPAVRQLVTFLAHNLASDPPYRDLDLVVCRNVFIYFTPGLQTRVLTNFHAGLKEGGFLLLGKSEGLGRNGERLFHTVERSAKLYRKFVDLFTCVLPGPGLGADRL